jgi:acyl-CoA thioesterase II
VTRSSTPGAARSLVEQLDLDAAGAGIAAAHGGGKARGYGGHTAALALRAAYATVAEPLVVRQVGIEYLRPAEVQVPLHFDVTVLRDGRTTAHRLVRAEQDGRAVAVATIRFHRPAPRPADYHAHVPLGPDPERLDPGRSGPLDVRSTPHPDDPARQGTWIRPSERPLPGDARLHEAVLLYCTDVTVLWPALRIHGLDPAVHRHSSLGTVSHGVWFHRRTRVDEWLYYEQQTRSTSDGLCHAQSEVVAADGRLVASVVQTGVLTLPPDHEPQHEEGR